MNAVLRDLSFSDLLLAMGMAGRPLLPTETLGARELRQVVALVVGRRGWTDVAREALDAGLELEALRARARAVSGAEFVPEDVERGVAEIWQALRTRMDGHRRRIAALPAPDAAAVFAAEVASYKAQEAGTSPLGFEQPVDVAEVDRAFVAERALAGVASDADQVLELVREESQRQRREVFATARRAAVALLDAAFSRTDAPQQSDRALLVALRALPELLAQREMATLERLASPNAVEDADLMRVLAEFGRHSAPQPRVALAATDAPPTPAATPPVRLAGVSEQLYRSERPAPRGIESDAEFRARNEHLRLLISDLEVGSRWMRLALATVDERLRRMALGSALLGHGRALLDRRQYRLATETFRDAVVCFAMPDADFEPALFDEAAIALVVGRAWPRMTPHSSDGADLRPTELIGRPDVVFDWIVKSGAHDLLAEIWADLPDGADSRFLELVQGRFASSPELRTACIDSAVTAQRLRTRAGSTLRRIRELLGPEMLSHEADNAMRLVEPELQAASATPSPGARRAFLQAADTLQQTLADPSAPQPYAARAGDRLAALLRRMGAGGAVASEPKLAVAPLVRAFFPQECHEDVLLPFQVSNDLAATPSAELTLQVAYEGPRDAWSPTVERSECPVRALDPGDAETVSALLQFHAEAAAHHVSWAFRIALLSGAESVYERRFNIEVRTRPRPKPNPFSTGQAIQDKEHFVGRKHQMDDLLGLLCSDRADVTPLVLGTRRIGKTSVVQQLLRDVEIQRRYRTHYWDVETLHDSYTTCAFLLDFAEAIRTALPPRVQIPFHRDDFRQDPYRAFDRFCDAVDAAPKDRQILVAIDEFDRVVKLARDYQRRSAAAPEPLGPDRGVQPETFGAIRKMLMKGSSVRLILCGLPDILRGEDYDSRLFGLLRPVRIGPFQPADADRVIEFGLPLLEVSPAVRAHLYDATGLQPYLLQLICNHLYARMSTTGRDAVTTLDLDEVLERDILPNESNFADYEHLVRDEHRPLLRALALGQREAVRRRRFVAPSEVLGHLRAAGYGNATLDSVANDLRALCGDERALVRESGDHRGNFRLSIGLLADRLMRRSA